MYKQFSNFTKDKNREEKFSDKLIYSKYWMRANSVRNNPKLEEFLTELYYNPSKRQKLYDGINRGVSGIDSLREEINCSFEYLTNSEKQALRNGYSIYSR